jgi:hypothetical protein
MTVHPIPPVYDKNSKILILGSFPSVKSIVCFFETDVLFIMPSQYLKFLNICYSIKDINSIYKLICLWSKIVIYYCFL